MMVPRAFTHSPPAKNLDEKASVRRSSITLSDQTTRPRKPSQPQITPRVVPEPLVAKASTPVQIPSQKTKRPAPSPVQNIVATSPTNATRSLGPRLHEASVKDVLAATAIPVRRKPRGRAIQRLPNCDHVAGFSKLLLEDVITKPEGLLASSLGNPQFDGLFGNIDELVEGQMFVGSEGADMPILSPRSVSSESMPSLDSPDDYMNNESGSPLPSSFTKSASDRRLRQLEDCGTDHPLLPDPDDRQLSHSSSYHSLPDLTLNPTIARLKRRQVPPRSAPGSFKSTLSASLRAIKSAAQTVSNITTSAPVIQPDSPDLLTRSVFSIQPALTDDKRPPPSKSPPSPALRRYLNPLPPNTPPDSPRHLHFWHEDRTPLTPPKQDEKYKPKVRRKGKKGETEAAGEGFPPVVPLQSCIPPLIRTPHASSPPIWLSPDGTPSNKNTAHSGLHGPPLILMEPGMPRHREPRENRDFLRVLVAEMNMRRAGKLEESGESASESKAVLWLPPVKENPITEARRKKGKERWIGLSVDDL